MVESLQTLMNTPADPIQSASLANLVTRSLAQRWRKYRKELDRCRRQYKEASVHDLRVSLRRLISALEMAEAVCPDKKMEELRSNLKKQLSSLGQLRDTQVQIVMVRKLSRKYPLLDYLYAILVLKEQRMTKRLSKQIRRIRLGKVERNTLRMRRQVRLFLKDSAVAESQWSGLMTIASSAYENVLALREQIDLLDTSTIHKLRKAFRRFRYKVEVLQPMLSWLSNDLIKAMNRYQVRMGEIQDTEVLIGTVNSYALKGKRRSDESLLPVHQELLRRRNERVNIFMASVDELRHFWKCPGAPSHRAG